MGLIKENMSIILQRGKVIKAVKLERGKKVVFEKLHFKPDDAVGHLFDSCFEVIDGGLRKIDPGVLYSDASESVCAAAADLGFAEDNRSLMDTHGKSQLLKREEIVDMKAKGAKGEDIVEEIVKNSASFHGKTTYSQKKYLKKKKMKHLTYIRIRKPSAMLLSKMYESREPAKICHMRIDTISQILAMGNIHHGSKVIVVETCSGLVLGLVMQRLGGEGAIVNLHAGEVPTNFFAVTHFNFPDEYWSKLHSLPLSKIGLLLTNKSSTEALGMSMSSENMCSKEDDETDNKPVIDCTLGKDVMSMKRKSSEIVPDISCRKKGRNNELTIEEKCEIRMERRNKRLGHQSCAWNLLQSRDMDCLVVSCRFHPTPLVLALLEFVAPSRPFVVYCENREPLVELFIQISISAKAVNMKISETFMRRYQMLPEQTHPHVMMSPSGGYLLTGITTETSKQVKKEVSAGSVECLSKRSR